MPLVQCDVLGFHCRSCRPVLMCLECVGSWKPSEQQLCLSLNLWFTQIKLMTTSLLLSVLPPAGRHLSTLIYRLWFSPPWTCLPTLIQNKHASSKPLLSICTCWQQRDGWYCSVLVICILNLKADDERTSWEHNKWCKAGYYKITNTIFIHICMETGLLKSQFHPQNVLFWPLNKVYISYNPNSVFEF